MRLANMLLLSIAIYSASSMAAVPNPSTRAIQQCDASGMEKRYRVKVWNEGISGEYAKASPEFGDGQILFINISKDWAPNDGDCEKEFMIYETSGDYKMQYSFSAKPYYSQGTCNVRGFFFMEPVMGIHQGWTTTYAKEVSMESIATSGNFCLDESANAANK